MDPSIDSEAQAQYLPQMLILEPTRLHWIKDDGLDDPCELCAHAPVRFEIDGASVVSPANGDVAVSAAAIYLLRTLESNHTPSSPVGEHLFPCCGHAMYDTGDDEVFIMNCPKGSNVDVQHEGDSVQINTKDGRIFIVPCDEWRIAVYAFSDTLNVRRQETEE